MRRFNFPATNSNRRVKTSKSLNKNPTRFSAVSNFVSSPSYTTNKKRVGSNFVVCVFFFFFLKSIVTYGNELPLGFRSQKINFSDDILLNVVNFPAFRRSCASPAKIVRICFAISFEPSPSEDCKRKRMSDMVEGLCDFDFRVKFALFLFFFFFFFFCCFFLFFCFCFFFFFFFCFFFVFLVFWFFVRFFFFFWYGFELFFLGIARVKFPT